MNDKGAKRRDPLRAFRVLSSVSVDDHPSEEPEIDTPDASLPGFTTLDGSMGFLRSPGPSLQAVRQAPRASIPVSVMSEMMTLFMM